MKKYISAFICFLLSVTLSLTAFPASALAADMTNEEAYNEYVELLNMYMQADPDAPVDIYYLRDQFMNLGSYEYSTEFWLYTEVMAALEQDDYVNANSYASTLLFYAEESQPFGQMMQNADFSKKYSSIRPVEEMMNYICAREEEQNQNSTKASTYYGQCLKFFDARSRYQALRPDPDTLYAEGMECIKNGDFSEALRIAENLQKQGYPKANSLYNVAKARLEAEQNAPETPIPATPVPEAAAPSPEPAVSEPPVSAGDFSLNGQCHKYSVQLSWNAVSGAASYRVYHAVTKGGQRDFKAVTDTQKTTITHTETSRGVNNYYYVEALDQNGSVLKTSDEAKVYVTPNPTPTPKPTWSAWSSWSATNPGAATSARQVEKKTQYRYRTSSTTQQWSAWSDWSAWSNTAVSATDSREVKTQQASVNTTTKQYTYTRWKYYHTTNGAWYYSYAQYTGSGYKAGSGTWQSKTTTSPLTVIKTVDGKKQYDGLWYNETVTDKVTTTTVTQYSYRTRSLQNVTTWSSWSAWQDTSVTASSTREVETRTVYRYRTLK